jgi:hypothetical protein
MQTLASTSTRSIWPALEAQAKLLQNPRGVRVLSEVDERRAGCCRRSRRSASALVTLIQVQATSKIDRVFDDYSSDKCRSGSGQVCLKFALVCQTLPPARGMRSHITWTRTMPLLDGLGESAATAAAPRSDAALTRQWLCHCCACGISAAPALCLSTSIAGSQFKPLGGLPT